jgi:hypothetical protein
LVFREKIKKENCRKIKGGEREKEEFKEEAKIKGIIKIYEKEEKEVCREIITPFSYCTANHLFLSLFFTFI